MNDEKIRTIDQIIFKLDGPPVPQARPRFARRGGFVSTYSTQGPQKEVCRAALKRGMSSTDYEVITEAVSVYFCFKMARPKSHYRSGRYAGLLKGSAPKIPVMKPDLDNFIKFMLDCSNKIVWNDDSQVIQISATKRYEEKPGTLMVVNF